MPLPIIIQKTITRGNTDSLVVYVDGDLTTRKIRMIARQDTQPTSTILLMKQNVIDGGSDEQILSSYLANIHKTKIEVFITDNDTNLLSLYNKLYFNIESESADNPGDISIIATGKIVILRSVNNISFLTILVAQGSGTADMPHGTTAERIAFGLTLGPTDRKWFFDDEDSTAYVWNGNQWK